ncbi:MAG TPA: type II toxin-antitoxin system VapC family toxin [Candidatus Handelsmanbacteria bacterium]|nr:type II toxin-antitoxin system VapC family toxin [Candidatus Handelsmanbacteria bacterium]HIK98219.1 type II toxin-antitoxin system VapC family toxin [Dehalococcoidia bacterium]
MVLVDTSIWIDHLRAGNQQLETLLFDTEVACHPYIIGELACGNLKNRDEILNLLQALPSIPTIAPDEFLFFVNRHQLMGLGIGFVDVHLLASALLSDLLLWTGDKHLQATSSKLGIDFPNP